MGSDALSTIFILLLVCCAPFVFVAILGGVVYASLFLPRKQLKTLADQLGWTRDTRYPAPYHGYFGRHQGRVVEMMVGGTRSGSTGPWSPALHLSLELQPKSLRRLAAHAWHRPVTYDNFESVFRQYSTGPFSAETKTAMLNFARKRTDLSLVSFPPAGNDPNSLPVTKMELQHTFPGMGGVTSADVQAVLEELAELAQVIETTN